MSFENYSESSMPYKVFLVVNKFTDVFRHRREELLTPRGRMSKVLSLRRIIFLASGLCENEANLSPAKMDLRGPCCPLVKRPNNITVISPPWLHLKLFPSKKTSQHGRRAFVLFSLDEYILFHRAKQKLSE